MVVPEAARYVAAVLGGLLVLWDAVSVIGTLIVPRPVGSWLTSAVDKIVVWSFRMAADRTSDFKRRDRLLAAQAPTILVGQIIAWLGIFYIGFSLLLWPLISGGVTTAFDTAGPELWQFGSASAHGAAERIIEGTAALLAIVTITLQISYLPTLYSAFNRRETEVALLNARGGVPAWGPELLARTHYALGSGESTINTLPDLYAQWERWSADVAESHTTYLPLVRFRSPRPLSSWVTSLLAVLDSAALFLALSPTAAPTVPARLCLRGGWSCLGDVARAMGLDIPLMADPDGTITLKYEDFLEAVEVLRKVEFPIEREPAEAWPDFVGWRLNYEQAAYAVATAIDAVPALWSGPRRRPIPAIAPLRPPPGRTRTTKPAGQPDRASSAGTREAKPRAAGGH